MENLEVLSNELNAYCEKHSLPKLSADDLICELKQHVDYLGNFIERWEAAEQPALSHPFKYSYGLPAVVLEALHYYKWIDDSYGNDVCPSWLHGSYKLWTAEEDPNEREISGMKRYTMSEIDEDGAWIGDIFETDNKEHLLFFLYSIDEALNKIQ